ncbi:hypothetical protein [Dysgonomonas sp. 25]|uniref:hypothetical protein n=1 Tax=Dysgonomonas sp. 25 TaxID=2302933 RepID=UPI0013D4E225|nr:hypothetical protein [Dysgonomonas sp. 25]NDV69642.1 hypothetical protein [Dysgonomonas sp. 25]
MKKYIFILLFFIPVAGFSQLVGVAGQWTKFEGDSHFQFNASASFPYLNNLGDKTCWMFGGGVDYLSGSTTVSGLNIKPAQFVITSANIFGVKSYTIMLGADAGYNFNFNHGNDGIILTPNIYMDYKIFYVKAGYDYNTSHNEGQFFVRAGLGLGVGFFKMFKR